ncbi:DUF934 domain-containing protein [Cellvibrio sp. KY-GH-1]|uniref:DUF934 domain-containing protein n=1 Tax=Cellvibrio sp. KY-GH-1 TaxID=2303332 RepID=UPI0012490548|nr:DUF934 domain-containing protein [Cellvibrio sp. KY-GH-1]QEY18763.1 DUF934 domain-containing protein [Cellvibrio sp. KY-GH-1]
MPKLIKDGLIVENTWTLIAKPEGEAAAAEVPAGQVIIPVSVWLAQKETLQTRTDIGVWLDSDESAELIGAEANRFPVIGVNFPLFMDGRAFSSARLLRERYGFTGELRAVGNFIRDQLCYLRRCGVNAFAFANPEINLDEAAKSLQDLQEYYQAAVDQPLPLFRRRA